MVEERWWRGTDCCELIARCWSDEKLARSSGGKIEAFRI